MAFRDLPGWEVLLFFSRGLRTVWFVLVELDQIFSPATHPRKAILFLISVELRIHARKQTQLFRSTFHDGSLSLGKVYLLLTFNYFATFRKSATFWKVELEKGGIVEKLVSAFDRFL